MIKTGKLLLPLVAGLLLLAPTVPAQETSKGDYDVISYKIDAELIPDDHRLKAQAEVVFKPLKDTQSAVMELNGSLKVAQILGPDNKPLEFVQDSVNKLEVRVNLGQLYQAGKEVKLTFNYEGQLATAEGGVLPDKRLSYVGPEGSYLMYAGRWFPFHDYFADRAIAEINITVPKGVLVTGYSEQPVTPKDNGKGKTTFSFVNKTPQLIGTLAAAPYINRNVKAADVTVDFYVKPGSEGLINGFTEELVHIFQLYSSKFGPYAFGNTFRVAE